MAVAGIVAEYNPFHSGHAYQITQARRLLGEGTGIVCVMSGNWVQRGECALTDKWTRAALALRGGADLVLELPLPWAASSAEGFARGAVGTLAATGVVDTLSFGSESGDAAGLVRLAQLLSGEGYRQALAGALEGGVPFAAARQKAVRALLRETGERGLADLLSQPNDNLAVEYLRALQALDSPIRPLAVERRGAPHDAASPAEGFASASHIRSLARAGEWEEVEHWTPPGTAHALQSAGLARMEQVERAVLAKLRAMTEDDFAALADSAGGEGLPARLVRSARQAGSLEAFYDLAKTKRYAHARIRRLALRAFLGLREEDTPRCPRYLRVLAFNGRGRALLKEMKGKATLPILTKPAHIRTLDPAAQALFDLESRSTDLFGLCFDEVRPCGLDYTTGPIKE